jgi:hypothetical protein
MRARQQTCSTMTSALDARHHSHGRCNLRLPSVLNNDASSLTETETRFLTETGSLNENHQEYALLAKPALASLPL